MSKKQTNNNKQLFQNDWVFVPTALSGFTGVAIGIAIGNLIGWI